MIREIYCIDNKMKMLRVSTGAFHDVVIEDITREDIL